MATTSVIGTRRTASDAVLALAAAALAAVLAAALTVAALSPPAWLFVHDPVIQAAVQTAAGLGALAGGWAALMRAERTRSTGDLALAVAIGLIALASIVLAFLTGAAPAALTESGGWITAPARLVGAGLLVLAARPRRPLSARMLGRVSLALLTVALTALLAGAGYLLGLALAGTGVPLALQLLTTALYLAGAAGLAARAYWAHDRALSCYAAAAGALALSRLTFVLLPAPGSGWLSPGDLTRLLVAGLLLAAAQAELAERRSKAVENAIEQERRRLAREIHDGLAQELAFIVSQSRRLIARTPDAEDLKLLADAGQAALIDARGAIFKMNRPITKTLSVAIVEQTVQLAERAGLALDVEVDGVVTVRAEVEHAILRIVGEAVTNAARHAGASRVSIGISTEQDRVMVRISDDGEGFDPGAVRQRRGFGLASMAQRAESLGGRMHLESAPGVGTVIEVAI